MLWPQRRPRLQLRQYEPYQVGGLSVALGRNGMYHQRQESSLSAGSRPPPALSVHPDWPLEAIGGVLLPRASGIQRSMAAGSLRTRSRLPARHCCFPGSAELGIYSAIALGILTNPSPWPCGENHAPRLLWSSQPVIFTAIIRVAVQRCIAGAPFPCEVFPV